MQYLNKACICLALAVSCPNICLGGADVTFITTHCVPAWGQFGSIHFEIDSVYRQGPFFVRFVRPDGMADSISDFRGFSHTYEGLGPGRYVIEIRCCATCSAQSFLDVQSYDQILARGLSVLYTKDKTKPELDSSAILMACTEIDKEEGIVCSMGFSIYNAEDLSPAILQNILEKAIASILQYQSEGFFEGPAPDAWIIDPFKVLLRFDACEDILWLYAEWPLDP